MMPRIRCSVPILTLNAREHLARLLPVLLETCEDVFIVDGNSTDGTVELAQSLGVRVERQSSDSTPNQRIMDFTEARLRSWSFARLDWIFIVDADEVPTNALLAAVRQRVDTNDTSVATRFRRLARLPDGRVVTHALFYPEETMVRLFHRASGVSLVRDRKVHERFTIPATVRVERRPEALIHTWVSPHIFRQKMRQYAAMEYDGRSRTQSHRWWWMIRWAIWYNIRSAAGQLLRAVWAWVQGTLQGGTVLPWSYTWSFIGYRFRAMAHGLRKT